MVMMMIIIIANKVCTYYSKYLLCARNGSKNFTCINSFSPHDNYIRCYYCSHFMDEEAEA